MDVIQSSLAERCRAIAVLVLDIDGVLTDGSIIYDDEGREIKRFHVRDGSGLKAWQTAGHQVAVISGRSSLAVQRRLSELGIKTVAQGALDKGSTYRKLLAEKTWPPSRVCVIADDFPDLPMMANCGLAVAVADACADVMGAAHYVTRAAGGRGAVREAIELILRLQQKWQAAASA
jgi:3-deoxy-D-manno-octulosonate 8-phosphate phosphatase (KDO 8-P phosphatase)